MSVLKRYNGTTWETVGPEITSTRFDLIDDMIAPEYSPTRTYNVGDYVVQSDHLYKCISAIEEIEEWTPVHWSQVSIGGEVSDLNRQINFIQDPFVTLESGTFQDANGTVKQGNVSRIRNAEVFDIRNINSFTVPGGYSIYIFLLSNDKTKLGTVNWRGGQVFISDIKTADTCYINFAIRKDGAGTADITEFISYVQENFIIVSNTIALPEQIDTIADTLQTVHGEVNVYSRLYEDVTSDHLVEVGQAYGNVGSIITVNTATGFRHIRIEKTDDVQIVRFNTAYYATISSYVQYVDSDNRIIKREYVQGNYDVSTIYEIYLNYPETAVAVYVTSGQLTQASEFILQAFRLSTKTLNTFSGEVEASLSNKEPRNYDNIIVSVCRIAQGFGAPAQSLVAYQKAIDAGMKHLLCDVRYTSDGYIVLCHDNDISTVARNADGTTIQTGTVLISNSTLSQLLEYDFGIAYSAEYAGTKILQLSELLPLIHKNGCVVHLELKETMDNTKCGTIFRLLTDYGMREQAIFNIQSAGQATILKTFTPYFKFGLHTNILSGGNTDTVLTMIQENIDCLNDYNRDSFFITCRSDGTLGEQTQALMLANGIKLMGTTFNTAAQVTEYINKGVPYSGLRYALTNNGVQAGKVIYSS